MKSKMYEKAFYAVSFLVPDLQPGKRNSVCM